ncbi:epithelial-stromal interaction protein 1 isoform X2 [Artibeus jamaicensis]|uniref:epithelial-stromal interaction protein 1 isoform X2 n=1 Tax=Artibeus jamaicensis TaxID=9417 RepID=UPI00235ADC15|nr:epithelial-stromal interaction protein 1 isoform X2 [Artibeus jamaicensis]
MYTRSRLLGSGLGSSSSSRPAQDASGQHREGDQLQGPRQSLEATSESPSRERLEHTGQRLSSVDWMMPMYTRERVGAYTLIAPNENRRSQIQRIAEKELENLAKWKEQHRAKPVHLMPVRLGGSKSEAEVRQKQQLQLMQSKYQQKLKKEEAVRIKKEAEEAEIQKMKAIQREKSEKLEVKKRFQENLRRETFREHQQYKTAEFLSRLETEWPNRSICQTAHHNPQSSPWRQNDGYRERFDGCQMGVGCEGMGKEAKSQVYKDSLKEEENRKLQKMKEEQHQKSELLEFKQQQQEKERTRNHQAAHRRVNNAFLDRLQGKSQPGGLEHFGGS